MDHPSCSIDACTKLHASGGFCSRHWGLNHLTGSPYGALPHHGRFLIPLLQRLIVEDPEECRFGPGKSASVRVFEGLKGRKPHRLTHAVMILGGKGERQGNDQCCHSCGNGHLNCITPKHLRWASPVANHLDAVAHGTAPMVNLKPLRGVDNPGSKLDDQIVRGMRSAFDSGRSVASIARKFEVGYSCAYKVVHRESWKHVDVS